MVSASLARFRWAWIALAGCAYFLGHVVSALMTGDRDDHPSANAVTDAVLTVVTLIAVWRVPAGCSRTVRLVIVLASAVSFVTLSLGPGQVDPATALVPAAWLLAAATARRDR